MLMYKEVISHEKRHEQDWYLFTQLIFKSTKLES
jgi:hypothetical protein